MRLIVTVFMTLDGVVEGPGFDEHRDGRNAWALRVQTTEDEAYNEGQLFAADALLLGRRTWQIWAAFWPTATGALADRLNAIPKYVVSNTLTSHQWQPSVFLGGDISEKIRKLKEQPGPNLHIFGSADLL